eukprot:221500_1
MKLRKTEPGFSAITIPTQDAIRYARNFFLISIAAFYVKGWLGVFWGVCIGLASMFVCSWIRRAYISQAMLPAMGEAVLVTGCSSGIGRRAALRLAQVGFCVFGGVRTAEQATSLVEEAKGWKVTIRPLILDVTSDNDVEEAVKTISNCGVRLRAIVNNAGISLWGIPVENCSPDSIRKQFEVNLFGAARLTRAFLPVLRSSRGRVLFVSSLTGILSGAYYAMYASSKSAVRAFASGLRAEVRQFGVRVTEVVPGAVRNATFQLKIAENFTNCLRNEELSGYHRDLFTAQRLLAKLATASVSCDSVAAAIEQSIRLPDPSVRVIVGGQAHVGDLLARLFPGLTGDFVWKACEKITVNSPDWVVRLGFSICGGAD